MTILNFSRNFENFTELTDNWSFFDSSELNWQTSMKNKNGIVSARWVFHVSWEHWYGLRSTQQFRCCLSNHDLGASWCRFRYWNRSMSTLKTHVYEWYWYFLVPTGNLVKTGLDRYRPVFEFDSKYNYHPYHFRNYGTEYTRWLPHSPPPAWANRPIQALVRPIGPSSQVIQEKVNFSKNFRYFFGNLLEISRKNIIFFRKIFNKFPKNFRKFFEKKYFFFEKFFVPSQY